MISYFSRIKLIQLYFLFLLEVKNVSKRKIHRSDNRSNTKKMFNQRIRNTLELSDTYDEDRFPKVEEIDYPETDEEEEDEEPKPKRRKISEEIN